MYRKANFTNTSMKGNIPYAGEAIEDKVRRVLRNKEPIKDGAPIIFMERREGVKPAYNPRTDRWDLALEATDIIAKAKLAKRDGAPDVMPKIDKAADAGETATG